MPTKISGTNIEGIAKADDESMYPNSSKSSYNLKGTTIPRRRVSQKGMQRRKNISPHLLLGLIENQRPLEEEEG